MFEDSLVESRNRLASKSRRWITVVSFGLQCLIAVGIVIAPLIRPEALTIHVMSPSVIIPVLKKPVVPVVVRATAASSHTLAAEAPPRLENLRQPMLPGLRPDSPISYGPPAPAGTGPMVAMGGPAGDPLGIPGGPGTHVVVAAPIKPASVRVSEGIINGLLLNEIRPVYPAIAIAAHKEGVVVIEATISKTGAIESARVVSGPPMLAGAAIEAVRRARYRPYKLNGEPTEVQTTVTVNFKLAS